MDACGHIARHWRSSITTQYSRWHDMTRKRSYLLVAFEACQVNRKDNLFEYELTWIQKKANFTEPKRQTCRVKMLRLLSVVRYPEVATMRSSGNSKRHNQNRAVEIHRILIPSFDVDPKESPCIYEPRPKH